MSQPPGAIAFLCGCAPLPVGVLQGVGNFRNSLLERPRGAPAQAAQPGSVREVMAPVGGRRMVNNTAAWHLLPHQLRDIGDGVSIRFVGDVEYLAPYFLITGFQHVQYG